MISSSLKLWLFYLVILALSGCAQKTTVALLADPDGHVGNLAVTSDSGEIVLNRAAQATVISGREQKPTEPRILSEQQISEQFSVVLATLPIQPKHFILYFEKGSSTLTETSHAIIPEILQFIYQRNSKNISVVGHSDTAGNREFNLRLSMERALFVRQILVRKGIDQTYITSTSHGKENPLVKTGDNVDEPKNRRVEVVVR